MTHLNQSELQLTQLVEYSLNTLTEFFNDPRFIAFISIAEEFAKWTFSLIDWCIKFSDFPSTKNLNLLAILR